MTRIDMMQMARRTELPVKQSGQPERQETDFIRLLKEKQPSDNDGESKNETAPIIKDKESPEKDKDSDITDRIPAAPDLPDMILNQLMTMIQLQEEKNSMGGEWLQPSNVREEAVVQTAEIILEESVTPVQEENIARGEAKQEGNLPVINTAPMPEAKEPDMPVMTPQKENAAAENLKAFESKNETGVPPEEIHTSPPDEEQLQDSAKIYAAREDHTKQHDEQKEESTESGKSSEGRFEEPVTAENIQPQHMAVRENPESFAPRVEKQGASNLVKTTSADLPADLGNNLASRLPEKNGTLTIELEPASLGKVLVKVVYEAGRASVSLIASNPRTLEILSRNAGEIAGILESKTGQETIIYTAPAESQYTDSKEDGRQGRREPEQQEHSKRKNQSDSFAQQLRLGLV